MYRFVVDLMQPFVLLHLIMGLAILWLWFKRRETRGRLLWLTLSYGALTLICLPGFAYLARGSLEWRYPPLDQSPSEAQAIVVLGGGVRAADGVRSRPELETDTLVRCVHALSLYRQRPCPIVLSGGQADPDSPAPPCADAMRDFMAAHGVADTDLLVENRSRTTFENATCTRELIETRGLRTILLVTEATHMPRSVRCFEKQGFFVIAAPCNHQATRFEWSVPNLLPSAAAAGTCSVVFHEWLGTLWYRLRGRID